MGEELGFLPMLKAEHISGIPDVLPRTPINRLEAWLSNELAKQYNSIDIEAVLSQMEAISPDDPNFDVVLSQAIRDNTQTIDESSNKEELAALLILIAMWSSNETGRDNIPSSATLDAQIESYVNQRVDSLYGNVNGAAGDIRNPLIPNGLDIATYAAIATIIKRIIESGGTADDYEQLAIDAAVSRAELIAIAEGIRQLSFGQWVTTQAQGAISKTWLVTTSANPRQIHLDQVGVTVGFNSIFPSGQFWSGELPGCKCGIRVTYADGTTQEFR